MKKSIVAVFALAACLAACNKAENTVADLGSREVKFTVSNLYTVSTKTAIADDSHVAIFAGDPINANNVNMTVDMEANASSGTLSPTVTNSLLWAVGQTTTATNFFAIYPYEIGRTLEGETEAEKYLVYEIASASDVEYANDFLSAAKSQAPGTGETPATVALEFKHPFAKLVYNINNTSDDFVSGVKISGIRRNGHVMFISGAAVPTGDAIPAADAVALNDNGENSFMTVVMPESTAVNPLVVVEMASGAKYSFTLSQAMALEAGKVYTASITITGGHETEVSDRTVYGSFTVTDWVNVDAGNMSSGTVTPATKWWYLVGNIDAYGGTADGNWAKYIPFKCIGNDLWQVDFYFAGGNGFKLMYAANPPEWDYAYGMSSSDTWVIDPDYVYAEGAGNDYRVHDLTNVNGQDINMSGTGNFRIKFTPSSMEFYIYKLD